MLLSDEFGPVATQAASRWLGIMPKGGAVSLTPGGARRWPSVWKVDLPRSVGLGVSCV